MEVNTKAKFKSELRSFFGLTILNLVIGAMMLGLGISLAVTQLLGMVDLGQIDPLAIMLVALGAMATGAGFYWIIQIAEMMDGFDDIKAAFDSLDRSEDEQAGLIIKMMAHYRSNQAMVPKMIFLGKIAGALFIIAGVSGMVAAGASMVSLGVSAEGAGQLVGGMVAFGVGTAGLLISRYFSIYAKVWDARLEEAARVEEALESKLEGE